MSVSRNNYTLLNAQSIPVSLENRMPITSNEKIIASINAAVGAIGTTVGIIAESLWFATTSVEAGGLGVGLSGAVAVGAITGVGVVSGLGAVPIAYIYYRDLMSGAEISNRIIRNEAMLRKKNQEELFFELIRLRSLFISEHEFIIRANHISYDEEKDEIEKSLLIFLVNKIYKQVAGKRYLLESNESSPIVLRKSEEQHSIFFVELLRKSDHVTNKDIRTVMISQLRNHIGFNKSLARCFKHISDPPIKNRYKAAGYGATAGLAIAGAGLAVGWTFGSLVVGAGLCAAIPAIGWAVLGVSCIVMGIFFGIGVGFCKQKNIQRNELENQIQNRNRILNSANTTTQRAIYHRSEQVRLLTIAKENVRIERPDHEVEVLKKRFSLPSQQSAANYPLLKRFSILSSQSLKSAEHIAEIRKNQIM